MNESTLNKYCAQALWMLASNDSAAEKRSLRIGDVTILSGHIKIQRSVEGYIYTIWWLPDEELDCDGDYKVCRKRMNALDEEFDEEYDDDFDEWSGYGELLKFAPTCGCKSEDDYLAILEHQSWVRI